MRKTRKHKVLERQPSQDKVDAFVGEDKKLLYLRKLLEEGEQSGFIDDFSWDEINRELDSE